MNATLVTALKNVLLNHLRDSGSGNATGNDDLQLLSRLLLQQPVSFTATPSPPHTPSPTLISGVRTPAGTTSTPLSRTSSGASSASDSSFSSTTSGVSRSSDISSRHEWDDNNDDDDDNFNRSFENSIVNPVLDAEIMEFIDARDDLPGFETDVFEGDELVHSLPELPESRPNVGDEGDL